MARSKKVVLATLGSLGDLNPCIAIALELKSRGHDVLISSSESYRGRVLQCGLSFHSIRPDLRIDKETIERILRNDGAEYLVREVLLACLSYTYRDLTRACTDADLLISGDLVLAAPLVAEKQGIPWISAVLSPSSFGSIYDFFPTLAARIGKVASRIASGIMNELARFSMRSWTPPVDALRQEIGLARDRHPLTVGRLSSRMVLGLFSSVIDVPRSDWPAATRVTGAIFYDRDGYPKTISSELQTFLDQDEAPLVFTLGSSATLSPGNFYEESVKSAQILGRRAVFLVGKNSKHLNLTAKLLASDYEPYSALFPRAAAVIQAAGAGSIAHSLRAGCPMLLLPYGGFDQPLNAARLERRGLARTINPREYTAEKAVSEISCLLNNPEFKDRAQQVSRIVRAENGLQVACKLIEKEMEIENA
jgi:rhamnosyltransferase subunit B